MTGALKAVVAVVVALALGAGGYVYLTRRPLSAPVVTPTRDVDVRVYGLGTVEARIVSKIGFEVGAALVELAADSNDRVARGQVLARLHTAEQEARVARARAALLAAGAGVGKAQAGVARAGAVLAQRETANARQQELVARNAVSTQAAEEARRDVDVAVAELALAESEIAVARAQAADADAALAYEATLLDHHVLKAPFDAVVVERHAEAGAVVRAGDPIFTLMDPETVWVLVYIDEERAGPLALGQKAVIRLRSLPHDAFTGTVARIGVESDRQNEERRVWLTCEDCPALPTLGEQAEARVSVARLDEALLVPEAAVRGFDGHTGTVWTVRDGAAAQVALTFGHRTEDARVAVAGGLPQGARIIAAPVAGLTQGRAVRVIDEAAP